MKRRSLLTFFPVVFPSVAACHARPESLVPASVSSEVERGSEYLRGQPAAFVVLGDATSFVWPALLQETLDAHAGRPGLYRLLNAAAPAQGIGAWTSAKEPGSLRAQAEGCFSGRAEPRSSEPLPKTALCLVSLRGLGDEAGPVMSANDRVGGEMGADALERLAFELRDLGAERVVFATPLYSAGAGPELGLEHVAIERLLARGHDSSGHALIVAGPDVYRASSRYFPDAFEPDGVRTNEFGQKLVAEEWYRWLAGPEAREGVVEGLYATDYDIRAIEAAHAEHSPASHPSPLP